MNAVRKISLLLVVLALCLAGLGRASAAQLQVIVRAADGQPLADAAVTYHPEGAAPQRGFRLPWPAAIAQQDIAFRPHVLIVPVGAEVRFPNLDKVRHHVYSLSKGNRFEIRLYGKDETRTHVFQSAGVAALGCNIHDRMAAYVVVVDTPFAGLSDGAGVVRLEGLPVGKGEVRVWHESLRNPAKPQPFAAVVTASPGTPLEVRLATAPANAHTH